MVKTDTDIGKTDTDIGKTDTAIGKDKEVLCIELEMHYQHKVQHKISEYNDNNCILAKTCFLQEGVHCVWCNCGGVHCVFYILFCFVTS